MGDFDIFWNAEYGEHSGQSKESYAKMLVAFEAGKEINHNKVIEQQSQIEQLEKRIDDALEFLVDGYVEHAEQALRGEHE